MGSTRNDSPQPLKTRQIATIALLFAAGATNFLDRASLSVANNVVRADLHLNATDMGWLLSAFTLAYGLSQLPLAGWLQRIGPRRALGCGLGVWSCAQLLTSLVRGFAPFAALRVLLGIGESPFYPAAIQTIRDLFPIRARGRATALVNMTQMLSLAAAPPLLTWIMLRIGWRSMFALLGVLGMAVAAVWWLQHRSTTQAVAMAAELHEPKNPLALLLRKRVVWGMMLGFGGINYTAWLYIAWIPGYLESGRHLSLASSGWVAAIPFLFGALGMAANGWVTDGLVQRGFYPATVHRMNLIGGMILSAAGTFVVVHASTTAAAVAAISASLCCIHYAGTSGWGYVQVIGGQRYAAPLGALQNFASFMIASVGPVLTGWLLDRTHSFTIALEACSAVTLLGAASYATLARPSPEELPQPD